MVKPAMDKHPDKSISKLQGTQSIKVLIVEDDFDYANLLQGILSLESNPSFEIKIANSLKEGIEAIDQYQADVILLDLFLPDSQGIHSFISLSSKIHKIPIVVLSGVIDENLALEAVRKGAQDYLVKGQVEGKLLSRVMRYSIAYAA